MIAMYYAIDLPADYDMEIIRRRVRDNGDKTDGFADLELKAYLIAEKGKYGNAGNRYAPFYVWRAVEGMNRFLLHGPFDNIVQSFGWPPVRTWFIVAAHIRKSASPRVAALQTNPIRPFTNLNDILPGEEEAATRLPASSSFVSAYNPAVWELCRFQMAVSGDELGTVPDGGMTYDIHHIS